MTGYEVLELLKGYYADMTAAAGAMKANGPEDLCRRAGQLMTELKEAQKELDAVRGQQAAQQAGDLFANAKTCGEVQFVTAAFTDMSSDDLRSLCDRFRDKGLDKAVVVLASTSKEKGTVTFACYCTAGAIALGANAGTVVREVATLCGGKGGGRPDMAMAGGKEPEKAAAALDAVGDILQKLLK